MIPPVVPARRRGGARALRPSSIDIPPPRYRVVEKDRRLVVIDRRTDQPITQGAAAGSAPSQSPALPVLGPKLSKVSFDGTADIVTQRLYDDKGPRTIRLDPSRAAIVERVKLGGLAAAIAMIVAVVFWPWLLAVVFVLASGKTRNAARARITAWLDQAERESA